MTRAITEAPVESYLVRRVKETGGDHRKVTWPGRRGAPDRLCGWPRQAAFVELKRPGEVPTAAQLREHAKLRAMGFKVEVISDFDQVDAFVRRMA